MRTDKVFIFCVSALLMTLAANAYLVIKLLRINNLKKKGDLEALNHYTYSPLNLRRNWGAALGMLLICPLFIYMIIKTGGF